MIQELNHSAERPSQKERVLLFKAGRVAKRTLGKQFIILRPAPVIASHSCLRNEELRER